MTIPPGAWPSPISAADVAGNSPRLDGARFVGDDVWWSEGIPAEHGRIGVFRRSDGSAVLPAPWSARTRVHEYGGGAWTTTGDGDLVFSEASDGRIHLRRTGGEPTPITPAAGGMRFGDLTITDGRLWAVRESHDGLSAPRRDIVVVPLDGSAAADPSAIVSVVSGSDFLAAPAPHGDLLAWIAWDHPDMPWDAAELRLGRLDETGRIATWTVVAGGRAAADGQDVSALQPEWRGDELLFSADPPISGEPGSPARWNLRRARIEGCRATDVAPVHPVDADTGGCLWNLGARWYAPLADGRIVAIETNGRDRLVVLDPTSGAAAELATPLCSMQIADVDGERVLLVGAGERTPGGVWLLDAGSGAVEAVRGGESGIDAAWLPEARPIAVPGPSGTVHAFVYPPTNPEQEASVDDPHPYVVLAHGGPTAHVAGTVSLAVAYLTSRGIGVLDVNYGGSSGYGRAYRDRLRGGWGIVDVQDVAAAATGLADAGLADRHRIAIKGGSAGGWTVLCALADTDVFAAGIDRYGVADLRLLVAETHDFESRYLDGLVGPLPQAEDVYVARSPLTRPERLTAPLLILQGSDDPVVPPSQSEAVRDALAGNGVPHAYLLFPGESHGFRGREAIIRATEAELAFLGEVFGFAAPGVPALVLS